MRDTRRSLWQAPPLPSRPSKPAPRLPIELIELIADFLVSSEEEEDDSQAWWATEERAEAAKVISLVCRDWHPVGRRLLWRKADTFTAGATFDNDERLKVVGPLVRHLVVHHARRACELVDVQLAAINQHCPNLDALSLCGRSVLEDCLIDNAPFFTGITRLTWRCAEPRLSFDISGILTAASRLPHVRNLDLRLRNYEPGFMRSVASFRSRAVRPHLRRLQQPHSALRHLYLELPPITFHHGLDAIVDALPSLTALRDFQLLCSRRPYDGQIPFSVDLVPAFFAALPDGMVGFNLRHPSLRCIEVFLQERLDSSLERWTECRDDGGPAMYILDYRKAEENGFKKWRTVDDQI
ncbi:hypothetical protein JCM8097_006639 [Rhodosporidiobolus ruineniae]